MATELNHDSTSARGIIKYVIRNKDSRLLLAAHMKQAVTIAFKDIPKDCYLLRNELIHLDEAITFLAKEHSDPLLARKDSIQKSLYRFFELMDEILCYSKQPQSNFKARQLGRAMQKITDQLTNQTNLRLSNSEAIALSKLKGTPQTLTFSLSLRLNLKNINPEFHSIFDGQYYKNSEPQKDPTAQKLRLVLLNKFSPELVFAYKEADSLLDEAEGLAISPDDEYFIEQVTEDYYPHIFEALKSVTHEKTGFNQKETVVTESMKQFRIIQLGLHKIIDNTIVRNLNTIKSQTDFLRNKVLGPEAINLSPNELELVVDASVDEAHKLREELYMKHVAPQLKQTREEYEDRLAALQAEHADQLKELAVQNWQFKSQITGLEAQVAYLNGLQSNYPAPTFRVENRA